MDDLDALAPEAPAAVLLAGERHELPPLTLGRLAAARRFAARFAAVLQADDILEALDARGEDILPPFAEATGIPAATLAAARADEVLTAFFVLLRQLRDFTAGPLTAALAQGAALVAAPAPAAPDGAPSSPGSSAPATR